MCPKPIHVEMKTGWFSDRSIAYLASGRPVLAEDTGFTERLPTGAGLLGFRDLKDAVAATAEIDGNYDRHSRAAREIAVDLFDSRRCLPAMLSACES
jgi:glycosyltransferase involved in cell wall biosynthesis